MLSQTAESLFWLARNMERINTISRRLEVAYKVSLMPSSAKSNSSEWQSILETTGSLPAFLEIHSDVTQENVEHYLIHDYDNPSSIASCLNIARANAKEVRTALTSDVWDAINFTYLEFNKFKPGDTSDDLPEFCDWIKRQTHLVRGAFINTQLHMSSSDFYNLGHFIERSQNTAQTLDIKYHLLLSSSKKIGGNEDNYQWTSLLSALSSQRAFHWCYQGDYSHEKIVDFFLLNQESPHSLRYCVEQSLFHLKNLSESHGNYSTAYLHALRMKEELAPMSAENIISSGLHEFLMTFLTSNLHLSYKISESFFYNDIQIQNQ